ncbi:putative hemolysin [Commensalibacter oyaizuii]|uniref:DUF333 domain-containing protein n=1 Tax=Commensalibacter oyaizuii TaxID=3043873 RepID=A0ABT6Q3Y0_9PROT|nr:DUF333 domain-containing protein [Commensalibacter sp. TBRC 16381]MDI2091214.1 DUF333 domain-containing protein [Commensalibacter sp. TBRC 16381]
MQCSKFFNYAIMLGLLVLTGCQNHQKFQKSKTSVGKLGMANPASVYCLQKRGKLIMVNTKEGQYGDCLLPSGERIEEWKLYRKDHT